MCVEPVDEALAKLPQVTSVLIVGIETHVCVLQTSLDLIGAPRRAGRAGRLAPGAGWGRQRARRQGGGREAACLMPELLPAAVPVGSGNAPASPLPAAERGYAVHVLVDGVSSQRLGDRSVALQRLAQAGAFLATSEMVLFQLMVETAHPAFKAISALAKEERPDQLPPA